MIDFREAPFDPNEPITWIEDEKATGKESRLWIHCRNADVGEWHFMRTLDGYCFTCSYSNEREKQEMKAEELSDAFIGRLITFPNTKAPSHPFTGTLVSVEPVPALDKVRLEIRDSDGWKVSRVLWPETLVTVHRG